MARWTDLGPVGRFAQPVTQVLVGKTRLAVTSVVSGPGGHASRR